MTNREKYTEKIKEYRGKDFCGYFIRPKILKKESCSHIDCFQCRMIQMLWFDEEYKEPEVDWSKVEVDTPILVRSDPDDEWTKRYFAEYAYGKVFAWINGATSWSSRSRTHEWSYAKLAEDVIDD